MARKINEKYFIEIILTPVLIALVGAIGTFFITNKQQELAGKQQEADRTNALGISNAQIRNANIINNRELVHGEQLSERAAKIELVKQFGGHLISCKENERGNALVIIGKFYPNFSKEITQSLIDCKENQKTTVQIENLVQKQIQKSGQLRIFISSVNTINDGSKGKTNWYFKLFVNGKSVKTTKSYSFISGNKNIKNNTDTIDVKIVNGEIITIEVQAVKAKGKREGLLAIGDHKSLNIDLKNRQSDSLEFYIAVPGFPDKGEFVVNLAYEYI